VPFEFLSFPFFWGALAVLVSLFLVAWVLDFPDWEWLYTMMWLAVPAVALGVVGPW
jgi:hypothetical protein